MPTSPTALLGLALPATGELSGTWGTTVNTQITELVDSAVAGTTTLSSDADVTLTSTDYVANQARQAVLLCTGTRTAERFITAPAKSKTYVVINATTAASIPFAVVIRGAGPTTGVRVYAGETATVAWNGADFVKQTSSLWQSSNFAGLTNVVSRTNENRAGDVISLKDFNVDPTGATNCRAGVQAFFDAVTTNSLIGIIPPGTYRIDTPVTISVTNKSFNIVGSNGVVFSVPSTFSGGTAAISLTGNASDTNWSISGFTISGTSGSTGTATVGLQIGNSASTSVGLKGFQFSKIENVYVNGFTTNISIVHVRMIEFRNCAAWYTGAGTGQTNLYFTQNGGVTSDLRFYNCQFVSTNNTNNRNVYFNSPTGPYNPSNGNYSITGMKFIGCDFYAGNTGFYAYASGQSLISNIWVIGGCQFDQETTNAIWFESNNTGTLVEDIHITDIYVDKSSGNQLTLTSSGTGGSLRSVWISQVSFWRGLASAINVFGGQCFAIHILDNEIIDCDGTYAININGPTGVKVRGNRSRSGALLQLPSYLIGLISGSQEVDVTGNSGGFDTALIDDQTGAIAQKIIANNPGYNPRPQASITVTASPFSYTNNSGAPQAVSIGGGTISALSVDGLAVTPTTNLFLIVPTGKVLSVTYSAAPTMFSLGL